MTPDSSRYDVDIARVRFTGVMLGPEEPKMLGICFFMQDAECPEEPNRTRGKGGRGGKGESFGKS